jgi:hypothetical protein
MDAAVAHTFSDRIVENKAPIGFVLHFFVFAGTLPVPVMKTNIPLLRKDPLYHN